MTRAAYSVAVSTAQAYPDNAAAEEGRSHFQSLAKQSMNLIEQPDGFAFAVGVRIPSVAQYHRGDSDDGVTIVEMNLEKIAGVAPNADTMEQPVSAINLH